MKLNRNIRQKNLIKLDITLNNAWYQNVFMRIILVKNRYGFLQ